MRIRWGYLAVFILLCPGFTGAQKVLYSSYIDDRPTDRFEIIGKAGDYYWIQKSRSRKMIALPATPWVSDRQPVFEIYDERLRPVKTVSSFGITGSSLKEYFVCSNEYFDQLILISGENETKVLLERYSPDGQPDNTGKIVTSFPFTETGNNFLLLRSEDKNKMLMLGFETVSSAPPRLHAVLFDKNWQTLSTCTYEHPYLSQPTVQYDFFNFPLENFNNSPVKLANNGDLLMTAPSKRNHNFLLFHFADTGIVFKEIKIPSTTTVEDVALSIDNATSRAYAGVLSRFRYTPLKNAVVTQYSLGERRIEFDSSYRFNTLTGDKVKNENLFEESLISLPGRGFMLLKEYGRSHADIFNDRDEMAGIKTDGELIYANSIATNFEQSVAVNRNEYTRYSTLAGPKNTYSRGDLSLFYLPVNRNDSCWSGFINKEQATDLNSSYLSYLVMPAEDRLVFVYNSFFRDNDQYGSSTTLDYTGRQMAEDDIVFYNLQNTFVFQKARQISDHEVVVPYRNYRRNGFAVIRF